MKVLIIGCGYVGIPLGIELVRLGHSVTGARRSPAGLEEVRQAGLKPLAIDLCDKEGWHGLPIDFDWVVNTASSSKGGGDQYEKIYVQGNLNLLKWVGRSKIKKIVYTSSTSVYAQTDGAEIDESSPTEPKNLTSRILVEAENLLLNAARSGLAPAVVLRVAGIYGPGRGHLFQAYLKGEAVIPDDGSRLSNMIHRDDVVGAIIAALERGQPGEVYNVVDQEPVSLLDFYTWLSRELGRPMPPNIPSDQLPERKRGATSKRVSPVKLIRTLGYQFKFPSFREGYRGPVDAVLMSESTNVAQ